MKLDSLTKREFRSKEEHTIIGANILSGSKVEVLQTARQIALSHHEKWNSEGYPYGLSREDIPLEGQNSWYNRCF